MANDRSKNVTDPSGVHAFDMAVRMVQEAITDPELWNNITERQKVLDDAQAGDPAAIQAAGQMVAETLQRLEITVAGMHPAEAAEAIRRKVWGLDVLEDIYNDPEVDEIRVNRPDMVFIQRRGRNERVAVSFENEEHVKRILGRLFIHDRGVALTRSTPIVESIRKDGTRVAATCPPVTKNWTFVMRKHGTFKMTPANLVAAGTLNPKLLDLLILLVRGRANIMLSGGTGTGKTSLLRFLAGYLPESLRIVTLESDAELRLAEHYPGRDIIELEEHPELNATMEREFRLVLRYSPDVIFVGEVRGKGEASEAIRACTRGADGSMVTIHFSSPEEAVDGYAKFMLEEGLNLPVNVAVTWVAQTFNVIVQMFTDTRVGTKKIVRVTEVWPDGTGAAFRDLVRWEYDCPDDFFCGRWVFTSFPSERLLKKMERYNVTAADFKRIFEEG